jgi:hypothetical protein
MNRLNHLNKTGLQIGSSSQSWSPSSLVVQDATPTHVDITFPSPKTVSASDFTITGITANVNSGSWTGSVYTIVLNVAVVFGQTPSVVYKGKSYPVINNVAWTPLQIPTKIIGWFKESEESAGQQPNKMDAGATHLTVVSGSGLNKVYTLPVGWVSADTDYCWWKTDASLSTTDGNRLIAYDFARTIIKYDNASPYTLRETIILAAGASLTTAEMNLLRDYAQLSIWWDNTLSIHGNLKGNRGIGQSVWTPESIATAPTVTTTAITAITNTTSTSGGNVTSDGGATITARGVCWNTSANPTTANSKTTDAGTTGAYASSITGLTANTVYYVRAYATNSVGTSYGTDVQFTSHLYLLQDTFTDTDNVKLKNHTMNIGSGWVDADDVNTINGNQTIQNTTDNVMHIVTTEGIRSNFDLSVIIVEPTATYFTRRTLFRYQDATHYWYVNFEDDGSGTANYLTCSVDATLKGNTAGIAKAVGNHALRILTSGNSIKIYWDGSLQFDITDATYNDKTIIGFQTAKGTFGGHSYIAVAADTLTMI